MARIPKDWFVTICNFAERYNPLHGGLPTNSLELRGVQEALQEFKAWIERKLPELSSKLLTCKISKGSSRFPKVPWISVLPPGQKVSQGVYFVICFGREGAGAVSGCISSVTHGTALATVNRSVNGIPEIDVDGGRPTTKYNNAFANPLEIRPETFDENILLDHIRESLLISFDYINGKQFSLPDAGKVDWSNMEDARQAVLRAIVIRQGQAKFRKELLEVYKYQCVISEYNVVPALEAAHIWPYMGTYTNHPSNGLLLRADLHTLFDLDLITIDTSMTVLVSPSLNGSRYQEFDGKKINPPDDIRKRPDQQALEWRRTRFKN
jgi:hypothetical protein